MAPRQRPVARPKPKPKPAAGTQKKKRPTRKKPEFSPETRAKLSRIAKERHARGELGGSEYGKLGGRGNTKEKRLANSHVAASAQENASDIVQVFKDAVADGQPMAYRLKGAEQWLKAEEANEKISVSKQKAASEHMDRAELIRLLTEKLSGGSTNAALAHALTPGGTHPQDDSDIIPDATVVED